VDELDLAELQEMAGASVPAGSRYDINGDGVVAVQCHRLVWHAPTTFRIP
jgi:hypothetical protein